MKALENDHFYPQQTSKHKGFSIKGVSQCRFKAVRLWISFYRSPKNGKLNDPISVGKPEVNKLGREHIEPRSAQRSAIIVQMEKLTGIKGQKERRI